jgi:beta-galactosidase
VLVNSLCNPGGQCLNAITPGAFLALEFGVGNADPTEVCRFGDFRAVFPKGPCLVLETYTAWYDQVGEGHADIDAGTFAGWIEALLQNNASVSVYMGFGGTNFGFIGGADVTWNESAHAFLYAPMTTSYSYGAPISEGGRASDKWQALRDVFAKHVPVPPGPPPAPVAISVPATVPAPDACADLFDAVQLGLFQRVSTAAPLSFEELGQAFGFVLYSAELASLPAAGAQLAVSALQDRALVFVDRVFQDGGVLGWSERPVRMGATVFPSGGADAPTLQLLVENTGRCSAEIVDASCARKGLLGNVSLDGRTAAGGNWSITLLPFDDLAALLPRLPWQGCASRSAFPRFFRFGLNLPASPAPAPATFLVVDGFGHGFVSVNSFNLGRFSCRGPVRTLFVPAAVLLAGARNEVVIFETDYDAPTCRNSSAPRSLTFADEPLWFENE